MVRKKRRKLLQRHFYLVQSINCPDPLLGNKRKLQHNVHHLTSTTRSASISFYESSLSHRNNPGLELPLAYEQTSVNTCTHLPSITDEGIDISHITIILRAASTTICDNPPSFQQILGLIYLRKHPMSSLETVLQVTNAESCQTRLPAMDKRTAQKFDKNNRRRWVIGRIQEYKRCLEINESSPSQNYVLRDDPDYELVYKYMLWAVSSLMKSPNPTEALLWTRA